MGKFSQSKDRYPEDQGTGNGPSGANRSNGKGDSTKQELERLSEELASCKAELREKDRLLSELRSELEGLRGGIPINEKEAVLEEITSEMERAQEMATMGSWVLNVDTGKVTWTPELYRMFGHDPALPAPTLEEQKDWYTEKSWNAMMEAVGRTSEDGSPYNIELETVNRDGSVGVVRSIGEAERDETGRIVRVRGVAQDIFDIKQTEAKLKFALQQEKAAQIYKDQFLANVSHEIRTPMNGMIGFASLLRDDDLDAETRNGYIDVIENCSNQLLNLIDDIIDVAKIEAGEIKIEEKTFGLVQLIKEIATTLEGVKLEKGKEHIRLDTCIPDDSENLEIYSDPFRIQQILTNLLGNALKFSETGSIEFGFELKDSAVEFFVKDEGIGIAPERRRLIFQRFEHLEGTTKKYEGTGLGLSISEGLAELLGANLSVESELGVGSIFRLRLPIKSKPSSEGQQDPVPRDSEGEETRSYTVLVAEDEEMNQRLIRKILEATPFKVLLVTDGEQAVRTYQEHPEIDLVLMDIRMPIMSGDVAAQEILKINSSAKIIAQTAYAMRDEIDGFLKAGFVDCIPKPFKSKTLVATLIKWAQQN